MKVDISSLKKDNAIIIACNLGQYKHAYINYHGGSIKRFFFVFIGFLGAEWLFEVYSQDVKLH